MCLFTAARMLPVHIYSLSCETFLPLLGVAATEIYVREDLHAATTKESTKQSTGGHLLPL